MPFRSLIKNITSTVEESINKLNSKIVVETNAFLFCLFQGAVRTEDIDPEKGLSAHDGTVKFGCDHRGHFMKWETVKPGESVWYNGTIAVVGEKYNLKNNDVIAIQSFYPKDSEFFLYCIQNEKETVWHYDESSELFIKDDDDKYVYEPNEDFRLYIAHQQKEERTQLSVFDGGMIGGRHFLYDGIKLYIQDEPTREQRKCLSLLSKQLKPEDQLQIDISKRVVSEGKGKQRMLLENVKMDINAGEMVLILGGSGAGKTTFLNAVMGKEKADAKIMIGKHDLYLDYLSVQRMLGYVPQQETLRPNDTVYMTLKTAALLKLPKEITMDESLLDDMIIQVLTKLGIEREANNLVSKLSGGQRKRLSVATEYITEPAVFFLDEPDSGVDGSQSLALMQNLREIANDNKIVLIISHAPDRAKDLFDKVIVLAKSKVDNCGRLAFYGTPDDAFEFFGVDTLEKIVGCIEAEPDIYIKKYGSEFPTITIIEKDTDNKEE